MAVRPVHTESVSVVLEDRGGQRLAPVRLRRGRDAPAEGTGAPGGDVPPPERDREERLMQSDLGGVQMRTRGYAAPEVEQAYGRALELSPGMQPGVAGRPGALACPVGPACDACRVRPSPRARRAHLAGGARGPRPSEAPRRASGALEGPLLAWRVRRRAPSSRRGRSPLRPCRGPQIRAGPPARRQSRRALRSLAPTVDAREHRPRARGEPPSRRARARARTSDQPRLRLDECSHAPRAPPRTGGMPA